MIHTRNQLIEWIEHNVCDRVLISAVCDGTVEVLGGFKPLPTSVNAGWLVKVVTKNRNIHLIAVAEDCKRLGRWYWFRAPYVEWVNWIGDTTTDPLFTGDKPGVYAEFKARDKELDTVIAGCDRAYSPTNRRNADPSAVARLYRPQGD